MPEPSRNPSGDEPEIADADLLFEPETAKPGSAKPARAVPKSDDVFELAGGPIPEDEPAIRPAPPPPKPERRSKAAAAEPEPRVDQVWSRGAEWVPSLVVLGAVGFGVLFLFWLTFDVGNLSLPFLILMFGSAAWVLLTYPILITLERPVRMTPEQAIKDYFGALTHHIPHYRRMWLLLSTTGRTTSGYGSYEGFRNYWKTRLEQLRGGRAGKFTPLSFQVEDFKAEKSGGKTAIEAKYTIVVHIRGQHADGPVATIRTSTWTVKGPDGMWYLNDGRLPQE
jgi:hypothetical protein